MTNLEKQSYIIKMVLYIVLVIGNIWCATDSFYEYAGTHRTKTLISGIFFFLMIVWFTCQAISDYNSHKAKRKVEDNK